MKEQDKWEKTEELLKKVESSPEVEDLITIIQEYRVLHSRGIFSTDFLFRVRQKLQDRIEKFVPDIRQSIQ